MEQKKILWVMMSVALLLVVLLSVGMIWLRPSQGALPLADGSQEPAQAAGRFDAIEYIREGDIVGLEEPAAAEEDFVAVAGEIVIGESTDDGSEEAGPAPQKPETIEVADLGAAAPVERPAPRQTAPRVQERTPAPAPTPSPVTETVKEFWIQVGSFTKPTQAEETKDVLTAKGVASVIQTKVVEGTTYFRVRIGPYANKAEAEKFLGWIKNLPDYNGSYISEVTATRTR